MAIGLQREVARAFMAASREGNLEAVLAVPGVQAITNLTTAAGAAGAAPAPFALTAGEGTFLDFLPFDNR